jgi:F-type H+-transporting ATPase subunit b
MNVLLYIGHAIAAAGEPPTQDSQGITTKSWIFPEKAELIYGIAAAVAIFALLYKFAGPAIKKGMAARTARIQKELDDAASDKAAAATEASNIREAKGDIGAERERLLADAAAQAEAMLADGRNRLETEVAELQARAIADIETARGRSADELRGEIARLSATAADRAVAESINDATHQDLIEAFIQKVGASS